MTAHMTERHADALVTAAEAILAILATVTLIVGAFVVGTWTA